MGIDQNAELMSKVENQVHPFVKVIISSIRGKGYPSGTKILLSSLKSIHKGFFFCSSFLNASVTGAAKGELDGSIKLYFSKSEICSSIIL